MNLYKPYKKECKPYASKQVIAASGFNTDKWTFLTDGFWLRTNTCSMHAMCMKSAA